MIPDPDNIKPTNFNEPDLCYDIWPTTPHLTTLNQVYGKARERDLRTSFDEASNS